jgi:hypothetical protein
VLVSVPVKHAGGDGTSSRSSTRYFDSSTVPGSSELEDTTD